MSWQRVTGLILLGVGLAVLGLKLGRVYDSAPLVQKAAAKIGPKSAAWVKKTGPDRVVFGGLVAVPMLIGAALLGLSASRKSAAEPKTETHAPAPALKPSVAKSRRAVQACNILKTGAEGRHLWQFDARGQNMVLNRQQSVPGTDLLPPGLVARDWRSLFQRRLNVAYLPPEKVFLRVVQLPRSDLTETIAMTELQLEKLSPIPVGQVVWTLHVLPHGGGELQTVVVILVARDVVEDFLSQLENQGYLADALELPLLDQLQVVPATEDGVWIYPEAVGGPHRALAAWWSGGTLQNLDLITLPAAQRAEGLRDQLMQMAWAGELVGWLTGPPKWHLVATGPVAAEWETPLREGLNQPLTIQEPAPAQQLASLTARRVSFGQQPVNLLPQEYATRYQQQFYDRLWMRGLFSILAVYVAGVLVYMLAVQVATFRTTGVENQVAALSGSYTNAIQARDRLKVLQDRQELKFAALDCWKAVAELLPDSLNLEASTFSDGKRLILSGNAPIDKVKDVIEFENNVRKYVKANQGLFKGGDPLNYRANQAAGTINWNFALELKRVDFQ